MPLKNRRKKCTQEEERKTRSNTFGMINEMFYLWRCWHNYWIFHPPTAGDEKVSNLQLRKCKTNNGVVQFCSHFVVQWPGKTQSPSPWFYRTEKVSRSHWCIRQGPCMHWMKEAWASGCCKRSEWSCTKLPVWTILKLVCLFDFPGT